jgi:hypothetical protein
MFFFFLPFVPPSVEVDRISRRRFINQLVPELLKISNMVLERTSLCAPEDIEGMLRAVQGAQSRSADESTSEISLHAEQRSIDLTRSNTNQMSAEILTVGEANKAFQELRSACSGRNDPPALATTCHLRTPREEYLDFYAQVALNRANTTAFPSSTNHTADASCSAGKSHDDIPTVGRPHDISSVSRDLFKENENAQACDRSGYAQNLPLPSGGVYTGQIKGRERHGKGVTRFANGWCYSGDYLADLKVLYISKSPGASISIHT